VKNQQKSQKGNYQYRKRIRFFTPDNLSVLPEINFNGQQRILDVGCSDGKLLKKLAALLPGGEFHGVDTDAKRMKKNGKKGSNGNIQFHHAVADNLPFDNDYFDLVICTNALHKFPYRVRALDEMYRVLKSGGECIILEGISDKEWKNKFDKILRQSKFIRPLKKYLPRTALLKKSYLVKYQKY